MAEERLVTLDLGEPEPGLRGPPALIRPDDGLRRDRERGYDTEGTEVTAPT